MIKDENYYLNRYGFDQGCAAMPEKADMTDMRDMQDVRDMRSVPSMDEDNDLMKNNCGGDSDCLDDLPVAMGYVPMQKWRNVLEAEEGLGRGTIFEELDLPFQGGRTK